MPWASLSLFIQPGCRARQAGPRCPTHARVSSRNHYGTPPRQQRGLGVAFDRLKPQVVERDGGRCRLHLPAASPGLHRHRHYSRTVSFGARGEGERRQRTSVPAAAIAARCTATTPRADVDVLQSSVRSVRRRTLLGSESDR